MKILAISLAFPPLAYPRSIQVARLIAHLDAETVLFCADEPGARIDPTIEPDAERRLKKCIRVPVVADRGRRLADRFLHRFAKGVWTQRNLVPDRYVSWGSDVVRRVLDHLDKNDFVPDVLVTFAQPFTTHIVGSELKRKLGLPWLAHFSDPWVDNPFSPFDAKAKEQNLALERSVAENADILVFTSWETVNLFYKKYPAELKKKARVLPHCYTASQHKANGLERPGPITVRYLGNFYGDRSPRPLVAGLHRLYENDPTMLENARFELIGSGSGIEVDSMLGSLPNGLLSVRPSVEYSESLDLMASADALLIIDAPAETSVFLPSKLIDYIGAAKPIFGITPNGTAADLIVELGGLVADPAQPNAVAAGLRQLLATVNDRRWVNRNDLWGDPSVRERFAANRVSREFLAILENLRSDLR